MLSVNEVFSKCNLTEHCAVLIVGQVGAGFENAWQRLKTRTKEELQGQHCASTLKCNGKKLDTAVHQISAIWNS